MSYSITLSERAGNSIFELADFYNQNQSGIGQRFLKELFLTFELLRLYPLLFEMKKPPFRVAKIKHFPIVVIYQVQNKTVYVYMVFNTYQDPLKIQ